MALKNARLESPGSSALPYTQGTEYRVPKGSGGTKSPCTATGLSGIGKSSPTAILIQTVKKAGPPKNPPF
jgi:hypothetical protein